MSSDDDLTLKDVILEDELHEWKNRRGGVYDFKLVEFIDKLWSIADMPMKWKIIEALKSQ